MWINTQWGIPETVSYYRSEQDWYAEYVTLFELHGSNIDAQSGGSQKQFVTWEYPRAIKLKDSNVTLTTPILLNPPTWKCSFCFEIKGSAIVRVSYIKESNVGFVTEATQVWSSKALEYAA